MKTKQSTLKKRRSYALEPRVLLDAAMVATVAEAATEHVEAHPPVDTHEQLSLLLDAPVPPAAIDNEVFFVDGAIKDAQALVQNLQAQGHLAYLLDSAQDGVQQVADTVADFHDLTAIHIVSHGDDGRLQLGATTLSADNLQSHQAALAQVGAALSTEGDILLYGCDIAQASNGRHFADQLALFTGADIAASTDITGVSGNWNLEYHNGAVETVVPDIVRQYDGDLALEGLGAGIENGTSTKNLGYSMDGDGDWVVAGGNGEVAVWRVLGATRTKQAIALPSGANAATFGGSVAIKGSTFVVGDSSAGTSGKVFIYHLNPVGLQWQLAQTLDINTMITSANGATDGSGSPANWGTSRIGGWTDGNYASTQWLDISGSHIVIGAPTEGSGSGRIAWFSDISTNKDWSDTSAAGMARGFMDEPGGYNSDSVPRYGASVALAQDVLVVGSPGADTNGNDGAYGAGNEGDHGAAFVYNWAASSGGGPVNTIVKTLLGNNDAPGGGNAPGSRFGAAVDIDYYKDPSNALNPYRYTIIGGAPGEDSGKGEFYVYQTSDALITNLNMSASNVYGQTTGGGADKFGLAVRVSGGKVIVGAPNHNATTDTAVFYYESPGNNWTGINTNNPGGAGILSHQWKPTSMGGDMTGTSRMGLGLAFSGGNNVAVGAPNMGTNVGRVGFYYVRTPVAVNDEAWSVTENAGLTVFNPLTNDILGTETNPAITVDIPPAKGLLTWDAVAKKFNYNPNGEFEYLSVGESEQVKAYYKLTAGGFSTVAQITITITGVNDVPDVNMGLPDVVLPLRNEPINAPNPQTYTTGFFEIPFNTFFDVDQSDILTYSLVSVTPIGGAPAVGAPGGPVAGVSFKVSGSFNKTLDDSDPGYNTGKFEYDLTNMTQNTKYTITVRASDGQGGTKDTSFVFEIARNNETPEMVGSIPNQAVVEDTVIGAGVDLDSSVDSDGDGNFTNDADMVGIDVRSYFKDNDPTSGLYPEKLTYSLVSQSGPGPDWLAVTQQGVLVGVAANENVGAHTVKVRATDIFGNYVDSNLFTITVNNSNDAPDLVVPITPKTAIKGEAFEFSILDGTVKLGIDAPIATDTGLSATGYFFDPDNSIVDGRSPSAGDTISYKAYFGTTEITTTSGGGTPETSWLRFDGALAGTKKFTAAGTVTAPLGTTITLRLVATDNHGVSTETNFDIIVSPRDGTVGEVTPPAIGVADYGSKLGYSSAINTGGDAAYGAQGTTGRWSVVGQPGYNGGDGRIVVYENTSYATPTAAPVWVQRAVVVGSNGQALGTSVSISANGMLIAAGAPMDTSGKGAVFLYQNNGGSPNPWQTHASVPKIMASGGANGDRFGTSVALNELGNNILVGAPFNDTAGTNAGAAYWGGISATLGNQLLPTFDTTNGDNESGTARAGDLFGSSVAFDQNMLVVGSPRDDHHGKTDAGSVYVYSTNNTAQFTKLTKGYAADGKLEVGNFDYFGTSVAVDSFSSRNEVVIAVGTPNDDYRAQDAGAVYIFRSTTMSTDDGNGGGLTSFGSTFENRITAYNGVASDNFGTSVAIDALETSSNDLRLAIGAPQSNGTQGSAYAYRFWPGAGKGWVGQRYMASGTLSYGSSVSIAGSFVMMGASNSDRSGGAAAADDLGPLKPMAGRYFSVNVKDSVKPSAIETPLSGEMAKGVGQGDPLPVVLLNDRGAGLETATGLQAIFSAEQTNSREKDELRRLLRPVTGWSTDVTPTGEPITATSPVAAYVESYTDALLFDARTMIKKVNVSVTADKADASSANELLEQPQSAPVKSSEVVATLHGLSTQVEVAASARSRAAQDLLASLQTLAG